MGSRDVKEPQGAWDALAPEMVLAAKVLRVRIGQLLVNERLKQHAFRVPVHLALGHEAVAVAVAETMEEGDTLSLTHRNIHYNIARATSLKQEMNELALQPDGVGGGWLGSMNMANPARGIPYTASILGNNLCVAAGIALAEQVQKTGAVTMVVTGDGALEEGVFFETLEFLKSLALPSLVLVENNGWSLATRVAERRCPIHLDRLAHAFDMPYVRLEGNQVHDYHTRLCALRQRALSEQTPVVVEVGLTTLGGWTMETPDHPEGKFINYHHGAAPTVSLEAWPQIHASDDDPLFVLANRLGMVQVRELAVRVEQQLAWELS